MAEEKPSKTPEVPPPAGENPPPAVSPEGEAPPGPEGGNGPPPQTGVDEDQPLPAAGFGDIDQIIEDDILLGNFDIAQKRLDEYKNLAGETPKYLLLLGHLRKAMGNLSETYQIFKKLYFEFPLFMADNSSFHALRSELIDFRLEKAKAQWNQVLGLTTKEFEESNPGDESGSEAFRKKFQSQIEKVLAIYREVLNFEPMNQPAIRGVIHCLSELGKADDIVDYRKVLGESQAYWAGMNEKRAQNSLAQGKRLFAEERFEKSLKAINLGLEVAPTHKKLLLLKAQVLIPLKKFKDGISCLDLLLKNVPNDGEAARLKARIQGLRIEDELMKGQELLEEADSKIPGSHGAVLVTKKALDHFHEVLNFDPQNMIALKGAYRCHILANNPLKAAKVLEKINVLEPEYIPNLPGKNQPGKVKEEEQFTCYVASRVFGPQSPETIILRRFRDEFLRRCASGRASIKLYERVGPSLARLSPGGPLLSGLRFLLRAFVKLLGRVEPLLKRPSVNRDVRGD